MMKKLLTICLTLAMLLSATACGSSKEEPAADTTPETPVENAETPDTSAEKPEGWWKEELSTVNGGTLTVATCPDYAPYEFYAIDENGDPQLAGFDMALAQYVADYLGLELEVVPMEFDGVLMEMANGTVDLGMSGMSPNPERAELMDFSDIYYTCTQCFLTTADKKDLFPDIESLNNPDISVGVQTGSIQMELAAQYSPDTDIVNLGKVTDIIAEILTGKLDGGYTEADVALSYKENYPELELAVEIPYDLNSIAVAVTKGNEALLAGVNEAIAAALADGSMDQFVAEAYAANAEELLAE